MSRRRISLMTAFMIIFSIGPSLGQEKESSVKIVIHATHHFSEYTDSLNKKPGKENEDGMTSSSNVVVHIEDNKISGNVKNFALLREIESGKKLKNLTNYLDEISFKSNELSTIAAKNDYRGDITFLVKVKVGYQGFNRENHEELRVSWSDLVIYFGDFVVDTKNRIDFSNDKEITKAIESAFTKNSEHIELIRRTEEAKAKALAKREAIKRAAESALKEDSFFNRSNNKKDGNLEIEQNSLEDLKK